MSSLAEALAAMLDKVSDVCMDAATRLQPTIYDADLDQTEAERPPSKPWCVWCNTRVDVEGLSPESVMALMMDHEMHCTAHPLNVRIKDLEAEVEDAKALSVFLKEATLKPGSASAIIAGEGAKWFTQLLAAWFMATGGKNYTEWRMREGDQTLETNEFVITCQRKAGKTPAEMKTEADQRADRFKLALESAHDYLAETLSPCDHDCTCILHEVEAVLGKPSTKGTGRKAETTP